MPMAPKDTKSSPKRDAAKAAKAGRGAADNGRPIKPSQAAKEVTNGKAKAKAKSQHRTSRGKTAAAGAKPASKAKTALKGMPPYKSKASYKGKAGAGAAAAGHQAHNKQKEIRKLRRAESNPRFTLITNLKSIWEKARVKELPPAERKEQIAALMKLAKGHIMEIIMQHDSARVVNTMLKFGTAEDRAVIFEELKDHVIELANSKYARHIVPKLLEVGNAQQRNFLISQFYGRVEKLITKKIASEVLASMYLGYCNAKQRSALVEEFFGPQFALFKVADQRSLKEVCEAYPDKKKAILTHIETVLHRILDKSIAAHEIVHRVLREFLEVADGSFRTDMLESIQGLLVEMVHTKEGSKVAMLSLYHGTAKDRKNILRSMKPYAEKIATNEYGHMVVMAALDLVDDTVLLDKTLLEPLGAHLQMVCESVYGRRVLFYVVAHRSTKYLIPPLIQELQALDGSPNSKKDMSPRRSELLAFASPLLLKLVAEQAAHMCREGQSSLLTFAILETCAGDRTAAFKAVVQESTAAEEPLMDHGPGHKLLQSLIRLPKRDGESESFASLLLSHLQSTDNLKAYAAGNRSAFVLCRLVTHLEVGEAARAALKNCVPKSPSRPGAEQLVARMNEPLGASSGDAEGDETQADEESAAQSKKNSPKRSANGDAKAPASTGKKAKTTAGGRS